MKLLLEDKKRSPEVGDIIEFHMADDRDENRMHYMICECGRDGFFIMNITGVKSRIRFYGSVNQLIRNQKNINKIYSKHEWALRLTKIDG